MTFIFKSNIARVILWGVLVLVLAIDAYAMWNFFGKPTQVAIFIKIMALFGIALKLAVLWCLISFKGPIKGLIYTWGGLFVISGATGLLSFALSKHLEPIQAYFDKALFLAAGISLIVIANKYIAIVQPEQKSQEDTVNS